MTMRPRTPFLLAAALALFALAPATAQRKDSDIKYRLAQSYERSGDYESALRIYRELYQADSLNVVVIDALKRDLIQLKKYDEAIGLLERLVRRTPTDINLLGQLGSVYAQNNDTKRATEAWERAVAIEPAKEPTYRFVGSWAVQSRLFDYAIALYKRGRARIGDPTLFAGDVAYLESIMLHYAEATREYLAMLKANAGQLSYVQGRIAGYTGKAEGLTAATTVVEDAARTDQADVALQRLLAWLYMEGKEFPKAYDVVTGIDRRTNAGGKELFAFAERALRERAFPVAANAYRAVIDGHPQFEGIAQAKFGYARTLEEIGLASDTTMPFGPLASRSEAQGASLYGGAVAAYRQVLAGYPALDVAAKSQYRIATIEYERYGDLDAARASLEAILKNFPTWPMVLVDAHLLLGEVLLVQGDLERAAAQDAAVAGKPPYIGEQRERAALRLAELDFFGGRFDDCLAKLADLTRNPTADATNDALTLRMFVEENKKAGVEGLTAYAKADLLFRQRKLSEAVARFEAIMKAYPGSDLIDETLLRIGAAYARMGRYDDAAKAYGRFAADYPESIALDRALIELARVEAVGLKDIPKAIATYQQLLEKFPNSIYVSEARRRARELRGDTL